MNLTSREEDYLETIYLLSKKGNPVGVSDVARDMGVTLPTVNSAVNRLKQSALVQQELYGKIILTPEGKNIGAGIYRAHKALRLFLHDILKLPAEIAECEACRMEHSISRETMKRLEILVEKIHSSDLGDIDYKSPGLMRS